MVMSFMPILLCLLLCFFTASAAEPPRAEIGNQAITARFYLPDPVNGYYRGTRFDWSGVIYSLRTARHEYFGQWFPRYDPKLHDAIMGPVEEFRSADGGLGYSQALPGQTFVRIGVGAVRKPAENEYLAFKTYEIVDPGKWTVKVGRDNIRFVHELNAGNGYAYRYTKTVRLPGLADPVMVIEHSLENRGSKPIETAQYNHNFFVIDGRSVGPPMRVQFPFALKAKRPFATNLAEVEGGEIRYNEYIPPGESIYGEFEGFGTAATDYDIRVENRDSGAGVRIRGDRPIVRLVYWSIKTVLSPEAYIQLNVAPGKTEKWKYTYDFYELPKP